jgi:hypothetical protein
MDRADVLRAYHTFNTAAHPFDEPLQRGPEPPAGERP